MNETSAILVLGSSSSLGISLTPRLAEAGFQIYGTSRTGNGAVLAGDVGPQLLQLDLSSDKSCESFVEKVEGLDYETVILLIGSLYLPWSNDQDSIATVREYFEIFVSRYLWVVDRLIEGAVSTNLRILNISSRAAIFGSFDQYYAATKSAMDKFLLSKCRTADGSLKALSVAPGLIEGSGMARHFDPEHLQSHRERADSQLLDVDSAAKELTTLLKTPNELWDGRTITIGPVYN